MSVYSAAGSLAAAVTLHTYSATLPLGPAQVIFFDPAFVVGLLTEITLCFAIAALITYTASVLFLVFAKFISLVAYRIGQKESPEILWLERIEKYPFQFLFFVLTFCFLYFGESLLMGMLVMLSGFSAGFASTYVSYLFVRKRMDQQNEIKEGTRFISEREWRLNATFLFYIIVSVGFVTGYVKGHEIVKTASDVVLFSNGEAREVSLAVNLSDFLLVIESQNFVLFNKSFVERIEVKPSP